MDRGKLTKFAGFNEIVEVVHGLQSIPFVIAYTDPKDGDLLPINNDDNFVRALTIARPLMRLLVQKKGMGFLYLQLQYSNQIKFIYTLHTRLALGLKCV